VALLHEFDGVDVERNVLLPTLSDPTHIREIDVLITGNVAGHAHRIPIECKNYGNKISAGQIGEFSDKLIDVGLPVRNSLYVCVSGYTRDARRRAKDLGIKIFELKGLTSDRLNSAVYQAFQSIMHLLLRVDRITFSSERDEDSMWSVMFMTDRWGNIRGGLWDIIWEKWQSGEIPTNWGSQEMVIEPPAGWAWHIDIPEQPRQVTVILKVIGLILTATGEANMHLLKDVLEEKLDRARIRAIFQDSPDAIKLTVVDDEEQFQAATRPGGIANIVFESKRAPRIHVLDKLYWPPTERAAGIVKNKVEALLDRSPADMEAIQNLTFAELEGTDIAAIWGETWSGHPFFRGEGWPQKYPQRGPRRHRTRLRTHPAQKR